MDRQQRDKIIAESDAPATELAEQFGVSRSTVYRIKQRAALAQSVPEPETETFAAARANRGLQFKALGTSGLTRYGGRVEEEYQRELREDGGINLFTQMANHPVAAAVLFAIQMAMRAVNWYAEPASDDKRDEEAAEFLEQCMEDMSQTWDDVISQAGSMFKYGYQLAEIIYKKRQGLEPRKDAAKSRFSDGKIGWRRLQFISPKSLSIADRWDFDDYGRVQGFTQEAPPDYKPVYIPMEKALLFRTWYEWDNPEGISLLRPMYQPWYFAENLAEVEAIAAERMGAGLPVVYLGSDIPKDTNDVNGAWALAKDIVREVRVDEQMGVVIPYPKMGTGAADGTGMLFELLSAPSQGMDFNGIIDRHEKRMAMTVLAQFIFLGMLQVGTQALNNSATDTFQMSIGAFADSIAGVFNRFAIPRLFSLNPFPQEVLRDLPQLKHSDIGVPDLPALAQFINQLVGVQVLTPDGQLETHLREQAGLPEQEEPEVEIAELPPAPEGEEPEEEEEPAVQITDEEETEAASEYFGLRTIRGALARDMQTGRFARGSGKPSEEDVQDGDAIAFGRMTKDQAAEFEELGLISGGKYTDAGKQLSREMQRSPRAALDKLKGLRRKHGKGVKVPLKKKGGGKKGGKGSEQAANREKVAGRLADKGVTPEHLAAMDAIKAGDEVDEATAAEMVKLGLAEQTEDGLVTTTKGRSVLSAANSGDVDAALRAMQKKEGGRGRAAAKPKAGGKKKKAEPKPPTRSERLQDAAPSKPVADAVSKLAGATDKDAAVADLPGEVRGALLDMGLLDEAEGGAVLGDEGRRLLRLIESGDWDGVKDILQASESADFFEFNHLVDEEFALRLKRGGPKWERSTNAYEMELRSEYAGWAEDAAADLAGTDDPATFEAKLRDHIDELVIALVLLGRRRLPEAQALGLGDAVATPEATAGLAEAIAQNEGYVRDSLAADIMAKVNDADAMVKDDRESLAAVFNTFLGRVGSYAGAYWALVHLGLADKAKQTQLARLAELRRERPDDLDVELIEEAKVPVRWFLDPSVVNHCNTCLTFGDRTYDSWDDMLRETGGVYPSNGTDCNGNCRCSVSALAGDDYQREWKMVWTHLAQPGGGMPLVGPTFT